MGDLRVLVAGLAVALLISVGVSAVPSEPRKIRVTATEFEFVPSRIELKVWEPVEITFESLDTRHDFACRALNLGRVVFEKDKPTTITFTPEKEGAFDFACVETCGVGRAALRGAFVVVP